MRALFLVAFLGLGVPALAQEAAPTPQPPADVDEVIVPGTRPQNLRVEIERLEGAVYQRWNALNSNDEFDIRCLEMEPTGTNITKRTCAPNFVIEAESEAAQSAMRDARGRADSRNPAELSQRMEEKSRELTAEMQRIAREDEELLRDLVRLDELRQLQSNERRADR